MKENSSLYEINTLAWLGELSSLYGKTIKLGKVPSEQWDRLRRLGFDYVWLMGVWKRSPEGVRLFKESPEWPALGAHFDTVLPGWTDDDVTGSPYSIASYTQEPRIGSWADIDMARDELHSRGMKLILDFVPNHTAPDHPWIFEHPDYYIQGSETDYRQNPGAFFPVQKGERTFYIARGRDPYFPSWPDTAQLNYFSQEARAALLGELKEIAKHCDGVRCDMAMLVLKDVFTKNWAWANRGFSHEAPGTEFWEEARRALPDFILIAEAYWDTEWRLQQLGFDYVYDKRLYDRLRTAAPREINLHLKADFSFQKKLLRFIENHDEPRSADAFDRGELRAAAVLFTTLPGMKLYHHGQFEGKKIKMPMLLRQVADEKPDSELKAFYDKLLFITGQGVFSDGEWQLKTVAAAGDGSFENLIAYIWKSKEHLKLVVTNLSGEQSQGRISLRNEISGLEYVLTDELNGERYLRDGRELASPGLHVILKGYHSHLFDVAAAIEL